MKISLKNIGKIKSASVEINGITVIAGENDTGKSTVGKALYCLFSAFHNINDKINEERIKSVYRVLFSPLWRRGDMGASYDFKDISKEICENKDYYIGNPEELNKRLSDIYRDNGINDIGELEKLNDQILQYLKLDEEHIKANVLKNVLQSEFNMQIGHVNFRETSSSIILEVHDKKCIDVDIIGNDNIVINVSSDIYSSLAYIEDPFIIDELANDLWLIANQAANHRNRLAKMLIKKRERSIVSNVMEEMTVSEKLNYTFKVLNPICEGSLIKTEDSYAYNSEKYEKPLALSNISTGLKTFLILKTLLLNGSIDEGGTIILDEPEIHLHPQWQLLFAELIVLMQKEFGVHILLNTHSPYFLNAIEVYTAKYGIEDRCKYYLACSQDGFSTIEDVTNHLEAIYSQLARPLQSLENERGRL